MIDNLNFPEILANSDNLPKTRIKKPNLKIKYYDEDTKRNLKLSRIIFLEDDEEIQKEDKDDSDYEMNEEDNLEKKKRARKIASRVSRQIRFGRINLAKYFNQEKTNSPGENQCANYNNILVKAPYINKLHRSAILAYKICNICFGFAVYTCPHCSDKYCSKECFKTHREVKCVKYLEI